MASKITYAEAAGARIPHSTKRRHSWGSVDGSVSSWSDVANPHKRRQTVMAPSEATAVTAEKTAPSSLEKPAPMDLDPLFPKLDPGSPSQARRMSQRRKMVQMGKNTVGYHEYLKKVPKEQRVPRSMKTPATPDVTLNIPNKRWQGMMKAWYVTFSLC